MIGIKTSDGLAKQVVSELQMLTGVVSSDVTYMYYLMLKDGTYFKRTKDKKKSEMEVESLDSWFNKI